MSDAAAWFKYLVAEAERDLVFLWNIERGNFGGPQGPVGEPAVISAISHLLANGCAVGFGDPDTEDWSVPSELHVSIETLPEVILQLRRTRPRDLEFLVFAKRDHLGAA